MTRTRLKSHPDWRDDLKRRALARKGIATKCAGCPAFKAPGDKVEIVGNLCRVGGQFSPCDAAGGGEEEATPTPEATPASSSAPAPSAEETAMAGQELPREQREQNRNDVAAAIGMDSELMGALDEVKYPDEPTVMNPENAAKLAEQGLVTVDANGIGTLTEKGRAVVAAANTGDASAAQAAMGNSQPSSTPSPSPAPAPVAPQPSNLTPRAPSAQPGMSSADQLRAFQQQRRQGLGQKAMRPHRKKLHQAAYAEAKRLGFSREEARKRASAALRRVDADKAGKSYARALGKLDVFKDAKGQDRWVTITTTAYQDQDQEWISRKGIRSAVAHGDATGHRGPLRFWHVPGADFGDCDFQAHAEDGRILIESGTFRSPAHAAVVKEAARRGYQMSPGFIHPADEPNGGVYNHIQIFERSFLPAGRASNPFTSLKTLGGIMSLDATKRKALADLGLSPQAIATLEADVARTDKEAQQHATFKEAPTVYDVPGFGPSIIVDNKLVSLKAITEKAPMSPGEMAAAASTELADAAARAEEEGADAVAMDVVDMTADDLRSLIREEIGAALELNGSSFADKMQDIRGQFEAFGKSIGAMKEARNGSVDQVSALEAKFAALEQKFKELEGDAPTGIPVRVSDADAQKIAEKARGGADPAATLPTFDPARDAQNWIFGPNGQ